MMRERVAEGGAGAPPVVVVIQARTGSTRLPNKVLLRLGQRTVLEHVIARARAIPGASRVVVATTTVERDDAVASIAEAAGVPVTRGPEHDVLTRFIRAFDDHGGDIGIRVTADCPFLDPRLVGDALARFLDDGAIDYLSNAVMRTYPRGFDFEIFRVAALRRADEEASDAYSREHVTPYLYRNPDRFTLAAYTRPDPLGTAEWRVTLDTPADWEVIRHVHAALSAEGRAEFGLEAVEGYLRLHPDVRDLSRDSVGSSC